MKPKQMAGLAILSVSNLILNFAFQWYVVTSLGSGQQTDALFAAMIVPMIILSVVSSSLTHVLVPILSCKSGRAFEEDAWMYFYLVGFFFLLAAIVLIALDDIWIPLILPGFDDSAISLTTNIFEIQVFGIVGISLVAVLEAASHAKMKFYNVEIVKNIVGLIALLALSLNIDKYGVYAAALIMAFRPLLSVLLMLKHLGHSRPPRVDKKEIIAVWKKLKYLMAGTIYYKTDPLLDRFLLSMSTMGSITIYHIAQQIYAAGSAIVSRAIVSPLVPLLSRHAKANRWRSFRKDYLSRFLLVTGIALLGLAAIALIGQYLLELMFLHGNFDSDSVRRLWELMLLLFGTFIAGSAGQILASSFYAYGNTRTPTHIGIAGYTVGIVLKIVGFYYYGVAGVAVAASSYYVLNAILLYIFLEKRINKKIIGDAEFA